jgi:membrane protein YdbS with pleckstrin-like domain
MALPKRIADLAPEPPADEARPGVKHVHPVADVTGFEAGEGANWRPAWQIFLPSFAILLLYFGVWAYFHLIGKADAGLARLSLMVMGVGVPLLAVHAFLRYQTIRIQVVENAVRYHPGWPKDMPVDMPLDLIERVRVRRGISGRLFGLGTLVLDLTSGQKVAVTDLRKPEEARDAIEAAMKRGMAAEAAVQTA